MTKKDCFEKLEYLSFTAAMSQRYHQHQWTRFVKTDKCIRICVGVISLFSAISSLLSASMGLLVLSLISAFISVIALAVAIILNIYPAGEKGAYHRDLFRRWSDLRENVDGQIVLVEGLDSNKVPGEIYLRLRELTTKKERINSLEESPNEELLTKCYQAENLARTGFRTQQEMHKYFRSLETQPREQLC